MSILGNLYGLGADGQPTGTTVKPNTAKSPDNNWYGSFEYFRDPSAPPPPASEGGPTAMQIAQAEGYADASGMLSNGMHSIVSAMYGGGIAPISPNNNSVNPNYAGAMQGKTLGGIGDLDGWARPINWSTPDPNNGSYATLAVGDTFSTPAGDYIVSTNPWGQKVLVPQEGAAQTHAPYITNMTQGKHHLGINPETGEVWYQEAAGYTDFSGGGNSYYENPNAPPGSNPYNPNNPSNPNNNGGGGQDNAGNQPAGSGSSWTDVLNRSGKDLESWDPFLNIYTGLNKNPDWVSMNPNQVYDTFWSELFPTGMFGTQANGELIYARLLENLGLA